MGKKTQSFVCNISDLRRNVFLENVRKIIASGVS